MNRYVRDGVFDAVTAATTVAKFLKPISDERDRAIEASFDEADRRADEELAEAKAQREAQKLKAQYLKELQQKRTQLPD